MALEVVPGADHFYTGLREELGQKGLARARDFRWDECARLHVETYREAAQ